MFHDIAVTALGLGLLLCHLCSIHPSPVLASDGLDKSVEYHQRNIPSPASHLRSSVHEPVDDSLKAAKLFIREESDSSLFFGTPSEELLGNRELFGHADNHFIKLSDGSLLTAAKEGLTRTKEQAAAIWDPFYREPGLSTGSPGYRWSCQVHSRTLEGYTQANQQMHVQDIDLENGIAILHSSVKQEHRDDGIRLFDLLFAGWDALAAKFGKVAGALQFVLVDTKDHRLDLWFIEQCLGNSIPKPWPGVDCKAEHTHISALSVIRIFNCNNDAKHPCLIFKLRSPDAEPQLTNVEDLSAASTTQDGSRFGYLGDKRLPDVRHGVVSGDEINQHAVRNDNSNNKWQGLWHESLKRQVTEPSYAQALDRGKKLLTKLQVCVSPPNHQWNDPKQLKDKFGNQMIVEQDRPAVHSNWDPILDAVGASRDSKLWHEFMAMAGLLGDSTNYQAYFHCQAGVMIIKMMYSNLGTTPNTLSRASDVLFLAWKMTCQDQKVALNTLKYFAVSGVTNSFTKAIMLNAYKNSNLPLDGGRIPLVAASHTWQSSEDPAAAILGSPNAISISWMFIDHYDELGKKKPSSVQTWREVSGTYALWIPLQNV